MKRGGGEENLLVVHVLNTYLNSTSVGLELFDLGQLHDRLANVTQTLSCQVCAGYVLDV
jgi:hypothetical protein